MKFDRNMTTQYKLKKYCKNKINEIEIPDKDAPSSFACNTRALL